MKQVYGLILIAGVVVLIVNFDALMIFLLSGRLPGTDITIQPSTIFAIIAASCIATFVFRHRTRELLQLSDTIYTRLLAYLGKKKTVTPAPSSKLPRRRFSKLS